jgi:signal transduction histidine kinase/uncharacterized tellurite resistance protein B-like protein
VGLGGLVALALVALLGRAFLKREIAAPVRRIAAETRTLTVRDLDRRVGSEETEELGELSDALNYSCERLARLVKDVERQRDEYEILYRFTDQVSRTVLPGERRCRVVELATRFLGSECVLVRVDDPSRAGSGKGKITMRGDGDTIEDHPFAWGPEGQCGVPSFLDGILRRWLSGEFDDVTEVETGWVVAYPLHHEDRHLGLLLVPAAGGENGEDAPTPELMRALTRHVALALEFSDLQFELLDRERLAAIGETLAGLSHCLKNTLNGLRAGLYILDRAVDRDDPIKLRTGWKVLRKGIQQVETLSFNMLYATRERKPKREPVNVNAVLREIVDLVHTSAAEQGVRVIWEFDEAIGVEPLDRLTVYRAVLNLVSNAIDACTDLELFLDGEDDDDEDEDVAAIDVEANGRGLVTLRSREAAGEIVIDVEDDGVGMSEETQSRLFTKFFSTKAGKGTGLGLSVVKKIVEEHGGRLEIESELGRGSTFRIRLPRAQTEG